MQGSFIGVASKNTGLSIDTIRFYEKVGLIEHPARTRGKFRTFMDEDIRDLRVIRRLVDYGFSLNEIKRVLELRRRNRDTCRVVRDLIPGKLLKVRGKIRGLRRLGQDLRKGLAADNDSPMVVSHVKGRSGDR